MPVIPATQESKAEGSKFKTILGNLVRPCSEIKIKRTGSIAQY